MNTPLVSVIVPTKNSSSVLDACLSSIQKQTYPHIELIVVDNPASRDTTQEIARKYTDKVFVKGPERCPQRNYGVEMAYGEYVAIIDSDMELAPSVITECVTAMEENGIVGVVIPEESFGKGFWAKCKHLERSFYVGVPWMEAARFFRKDLYQSIGGYNESMVSGEDWDLSQRIEEHGKLGRTASYIRHNEGHLKLLTTLKKKYYYAQKFAHYTAATTSTKKENQTSVLARYSLFFSQPKKLFRNPLLGLGMLFMKTAELTYGGIGLLIARKRLKHDN